MFVEPDANEAKTTIKADPSAPARSTIRRQQRTARHFPPVRDRPSSRAHTDATSRDIHQRRLLREFMRHRGREREHLMLEAEQEAARAEAERAEASRQQRFGSGRALLRDALSYERPGQRMRMLRDYDALPYLVPITDSERTSYSEVLQRSVDNDATREENQNQLRSPPPRYMPTPPYSFEESTARPASNGFPPQSNYANHSSRLAPADTVADGTMENYTTRASRGTTHQAMLAEITRTRLEVERTREEVRRTREEASRAWREMDPSAYDTLSEFPPLRRMGRRQRSPTAIRTSSPPPRHQSHVDGLGDRRRSFSSEGDGWDTLLTTITPDERVPSVHSSFTSATASASASVAPNPTSSNSYSTLAALPPLSASNAELYLNLCDNSDSEDSITDNESAPVTMHEMYGQTNRYSTNDVNPPVRRPVYSRRYDNETGASERRRAEADFRTEAILDTGNPTVSERAPELDMTYEDVYRRERLRHSRATEIGSELSNGVRPARERL
ncbi:MAG: hypothetical protein Q9195_001938 [Heterodermia aff. obscurata]